MKVDVINKFMLSLFFIYLLLISSNINSLLNCSTQRFLKENVLVKHFILFISVFILTFILNWYTPESIVVKKEEDDEIEGFKGLEGFKGFKFSFEKYEYLIKSFFYSIIIYIGFLATSKMDPFWFSIFGFFLVFAFIIFLLYKVNLSEFDIDELKPEGIFMYESTLVKNLEGTTKSIEEKKKEMSNVIILYNLLVISYLIMPLLMIGGVYKYYLKQKKDKKIQFTIYKFFIGTNKCNNI